MKPLFDVNGEKIEPGDIVQWKDPEGTRTAEVIETLAFRCIKNSKRNNWAVGHTFHLGSFMYAATEDHLRVIKKKRRNQ